MKKLLLTCIHLIPIVLFGQINLIKNQGLENNSTSGENIPINFSGNIPKAQNLDTWVLNVSGTSTGETSVVNTEKHEGDQSMQLQLNTIDARYRFYLINDLKNVSAGTYKLSFYAKANVAEIPFRVDIIACTGANYATEKQLIGSTYDSEGNVVPAREGVVQKTKTDWVNYTYIFDIKDLDFQTDGLLRIVIRPNCNASGSSGITNKPVTYWFDDFSLSLKGESDFSFEEGVSAQWKAQSGTLDISADHFKEGKQSLQWQSTGDASMSVDFDSFKTATSTSFYLYSPAITTDTLFVEFRNGDAIKKTARVLLNFKGWRDFSRSHAEFESSQAEAIDNIVFRRKTTSSSPQSLFFDDVKLDTAPNAQRVYGYHMMLDKEYFTTGTALLNLYSNVIDIEVPEPQETELAGIAKLQAIFKQKPTSGTDAKLQEARDYVSTLNIQYNADGSVKGNSINTMSPTDKTDMIKWANYVEILAASSLESDNVLFTSLIDYLLDQGISEGINYTMVYSDYTAIRAIPKGFLSALDLYNADQKDGVLKLVRWIIEYGKMYFPEDQYLPLLNADILTNFLGYYFTFAVYQSEPKLIARELKAVTRFLERNTEYVPGANGILKTDGTAFHHNSHYNNYMYSFRMWIQYAHNLKDTPFRLDQYAYERMKKAIVSMYTMATCDTGDNHYTANSLSGRNPFVRGGSNIPVYKGEFKKLIEIGGDILGQEIDPDLAAAYNYFFMADEYPVAKTDDYEGFFQFNYSPIGVYRKDNWVTTMRSPTSKLWGSEIYSGTNRFGRYQSHGTLEVIYNGTLASSGYPTHAQGGGWDWNIIPGATTVHYTSWKEMMPAQNTTQRFDQYTKTKDFAGALSAGKYGIFAADFDQVDKWGNQHFNPTNLVFKKSIFAFGDILICLGSNIGASGTYSDDMITATNLFQGIKSDVSGKFIVNGQEVSEGYNETLVMDNDTWMITPQTTGLYIPKGNDNLTIKYGQQTTPMQTGADADNPETTSTAAKAYINHGVKTENRDYFYAVVPNANATKMSEAITTIKNDFEIKYQDSVVHAVVYKPENITAYTIFQPVDTLSYGIVKGSTSQVLLMLAQDETESSIYFSICNPNLNPKSDSKFGWVSTPTTVTVTLRGKWNNAIGNPDITVATSEKETTVTTTLHDGKASYFELKNGKTSGVKTEVRMATNTELFYVHTQNNTCNIQLKEAAQADVRVRMLNMQGRTLHNKKYKAGTSQVSIDNIPSGTYVIQVITADRKESVKCIL